MSARAAAALTTSHSTFGVIPSPQIRPVLLIARKTAPCVIPLALSEQTTALLGGEPVAQAHTKPANAFHPANSSSEFWTEKAGVGRLVRDAPDRRQPKIDRLVMPAAFVVRSRGFANYASSVSAGFAVLVRLYAIQDVRFDTTPKS